MDDDALMAKLMAAFDDDAAPDQAGDEPRPSEQPFDTQRFLAGLDAIFDAHAAAKAGPYLEQAMIDAENAGDDAGLLTVLNERYGITEEDFVSAVRKADTRRTSGSCNGRWSSRPVWASRAPRHGRPP